MPTTTGKIYLGDKLVAGGAAAAEDWVRPAEWPALPAVADTDQVFYGLHAVFDHGSNFATIRCQGAYTVDWGDGSSPVNVASNTTAEYNYSYAAAGLGHVTSRGYKTAIVTVTPQAGETLSAIDLSLKHTQSGLVNGHSSQWLDMRLAMNNVGAVTTFNPLWLHRLLERFEWVGGSSVQASFANFLHTCTSLQSVPLFNTAAGTSFGGFLNGCVSLQSVPLFNTAAVTNFNAFLNGCASLQSVPLFNTAAVTNFQNFLNGCVSLQSVPLFNTAAGTNFQSFLQGCSSLQSVPLFNTAAVTNFQNFLNGCVSLQSVPLFNTAAVTNFQNFLNGCVSLQSVPLFNTAAGTNFQSFLQGCSSLQSVPLFNTAAGTNFQSFLQGCSSLQQVPPFNTSSGTNFVNFLSSNASLSRIQATFPANQNISLANLSLGPDALNEIYTNLPTASGSPRTITVTGNWGTAAHDPTIATNKGWTVTA
jgi:spore coat protein CotF